MTRLTRILAQIIGSVALFALFAVAGWAITDWLTPDQDSSPELETVALSEYPLNPILEDIDEQLTQLGIEQNLTELALSESTDNEGDSQDSSLGAAVAGGQTVRMVSRAAIETGPRRTDDDSATSTPAGDADEIPSEVLDDTPFLFDHLDLSDIRVADPIGPLRIDVCAGPELLPESPGGCSFGFGGTIVTTDADVDPSISAALFSPDGSASQCEASDDTTWRLLVRISAPGTLHLEMWNGSPDSDPPAGAVAGSFDVPADVAASMTTSLDAGESSTDSDGFFCISVPAMRGEVVVEHYVVSSYPPHGGSRGPSSRQSFNSRSGRPPSGMTPFGLDTLYVRTIRTATEEMWVKAVEIDPGTPVHDVCNTGGREIGPRGPTPSGVGQDADVIGRLSWSVPITIDEVWPYDPLYDTVDLFKLDLLAGNQYAVCTYAVDLSPGFSEGVIFSEAAFVATPTARSMLVRIAGVGGIDRTPEVERLGFDVLPLAPGCGNTSVEYPGVNRREEIDRILCGQDGGTSVSNVVINGGFPVTIVTKDLVGSDQVETNAWIPVDSADIVCGTNCGGSLSRTVRIPVKGLAYTESNRSRHQIAYVDLVVEFLPPPSNGFTEWNLGTPDAFDNTDPALPQHPRVHLRHIATTLVHAEADAGPSATAVVEVFADRVISGVIGVDPSAPTCARDAVTEQALSRGISQTITFSGLCLDSSYGVTIDVVDDSGIRTVSTGGSGFEFTTTVAGRVIVHAELALEPLPARPPGSPNWYQDYGRVDVSVYRTSGSAAGFGRPFSVAPPDSTGSERNSTGWAKVALPSGIRICDGTTIPPFDRSWRIASLPIRSFGWSISTSVVRGAYHGNDDLGACDANRNNPGVPLNRTWLSTIRFAASDLTLEELLRGIDITTTTPYGAPTLRVWAEIEG